MLSMFYGGGVQRAYHANGEQLAEFVDGKQLVLHRDFARDELQ